MQVVFPQSVKTNTHAVSSFNIMSLYKRQCTDLFVVPLAQLKVKYHKASIGDRSTWPDTCMVKLKLKPKIEYVFVNFVYCVIIRVTRACILLPRNIHLTLTLKSLCMNKLKGDDKVLINNRHRTFPTTYGSHESIDLYFVVPF